MEEGKTVEDRRDLIEIKDGEDKNVIFTLDFFLCYNYIKHHDIPLFSMTKSVAPQKQYITEKIVNMHNIFLHIL